MSFVLDHDRFIRLDAGDLAEHLGGWLAAYEGTTPGTEGFDASSTLSGEEEEPQPDLSLVITAPGLGQTTSQDDYLVGAPEWVGEVASGTESIDLHRKKQDYEKAGVKEYVVVALRQKRVYWFVSRGGKFEELPPGPDGVYRSEVFPGLWLAPEALLQRDRVRLLDTLRQGHGLSGGCGVRDPVVGWGEVLVVGRDLSAGGRRGTKQRQTTRPANCLTASSYWSAGS